MSTERSRPSIDEIAALYRDGSTIAQVADHVGYSSSWVYNQLVAAGVERRPSAAGPKRAHRRRPSIGEITDLYRRGWSLAQIGAHVGYSASWVAKQLTVTGVGRRPSGSTAGSRRIDDAAEADMVRHLCSLYLHGQLSLVEIGRRFDRSSWWVKDRLTCAGVAVRARTVRPPTAATPGQMQSMIRLYVDDRVTGVDIASRLAQSSEWVSAQLRGAGVAVSAGGARRIDVDEDWIEDQYVHEIPIVPKPGPLRTRFRQPRPLRPDLITSLYEDVGLSVSQITLITGHHDNSVRAALQQAGIKTRPSSRSPWTERSTG